MWLGVDLRIDINERGHIVFQRARMNYVLIILHLRINVIGGGGTFNYDHTTKERAFTFDNR